MHDEAGSQAHPAVKKKPRRAWSGPFRGKRRRLVVALSVGVTLLVAVGGSALFVDPFPLGDEGDHPSTNTSDQAREGNESAVAELGQARELERRSGNGVKTGAPPAESVVIGWFEASRVVAVKLSDLVEAAAGSAKNPLAKKTLSPVVGSPFSFAAVDGGLLLSATNHKQLVRLSANWKGVETLSMPREISAGGSVVAIGSIFTYGERALLAVESGNGISIVEVDLRRWSVRRHELFDDRFAGFPRACLTGDGKIALAWSRGLDLIDLETLEREAFVRLDGLPSGVACVDDEVWVSATENGHGWVISSVGIQKATFSWEGRGSQYLLADRTAKAVFGTDQETGVVFKCGVGSRTCETSARIGMKPTDVMSVRGYVVVTLEDSQAVAVLSQSSLREVGLVRFSGRPRALAYIS